MYLAETVFFSQCRFFHTVCTVQQFHFTFSFWHWFDVDCAKIKVFVHKKVYSGKLCNESGLLNAVSFEWMHVVDFSFPPQRNEYNDTHFSYKVIVVMRELSCTIFEIGISILHIAILLMNLFCVFMNILVKLFLF